MTQSQMIKTYVSEIWIKELKLAGFIVAWSNYIHFKGALRIVDPSTEDFIVLGWERSVEQWYVARGEEVGIENETYEYMDAALENINSWVKEHGAR